MENLEGITVRASYLSMYPDCCRRTAARLFPALIHADLRSEVSNIGAITGTATHTSVTWTLEVKRTSGELGNATESEQRGLESLEENVRRGVAWDGTTPDLNTAQKQVLRQARAYRANVAPTVQPIMVEQRLEAKRPSGLTVSGQMDVVDIANRLRDLKTGKVHANGPQYGTYSILLAAHDSPVAEIVEDFVERASIRKEQPAPVARVYDKAACEAHALSVLARLEADLSAFLADDERRPWHFLANPNSMLCHPKWCVAYGTAFCPESKQKE